MIRIRQEHGLSCSQVAHAMGLKSASSVTEWENGRHIPNPDSLWNLSSIYSDCNGIRSFLPESAWYKPNSMTVEEKIDRCISALDFVIEINGKIDTKRIAELARVDRSFTYSRKEVSNAIKKA